MRWEAVFTCAMGFALGVYEGGQGGPVSVVGAIGSGVLWLVALSFTVWTWGRLSKKWRQAVPYWAEDPEDVDLSVCPGCGGPADNGHDRHYPPSPYNCTKCSP